MQNNIRFDLSNYLIHFFRDIDQESNNWISIPEHMGWENLYEEDTFFPAFFMLRAALRNGRLWATWSIRNGNRTIYGPRPAICFTEMPIAAFLEAGNSRWERGEAMSQLAFVFPKDSLFQLGARPVISGLDASVSVSAQNDAAGNRMLPANILPVAEQYRYITFNIGGARNIDWSHEREWRWPCNQDITDYNKPLEEYELISSWDEIPGLDFYNINGIGVIVKNQEQADLIISDILTLVDSGRASFDTFGFVLITDLLPKTMKLQEPEKISSTIIDATVDLTPYFSLSDAECREYTERFSKLFLDLLEIPSSSDSREQGGCWLWLHDNRSPLARALLRTNQAFVSEDGRYLVKLDKIFKKYQDLKQKEEITEKLAKLVEKEFGTQSCYFSVLDSFSSIDLPFYAGRVDLNMSFFNCAWNSH